MSDEILVFEISGEWGHFKRPYTTTSPLTFDLPTAPTVLGYIGAVLGLDKRDYLRILNEVCRVSVALTSEPHKVSLGMNFLHTKNSFRGHHKNPHAIIGTELLKDPSYLIFCDMSDSQLRTELAERISQKRPHYIPCLGLSWCLAQSFWLGGFPTHVESPDGDVAILGWLPKNAIGVPMLEDGKRYHMMTLPTKMAPDRQVLDFEDMVYEYSGQTIRCRLKEGTKVCRVDHGGGLEGLGEDVYVYLV